jgi:hypothetical protein
VFSQDGTDVDSNFSMLTSQDLLSKPVDELKAIVKDKRVMSDEDKEREKKEAAQREKAEKKASRGGGGGGAGGSGAGGASNGHGNGNGDGPEPMVGPVQLLRMQLTRSA